MDYRQKIEAKLKTLPHKYQVRYALDCALECKHLMQDPRSLKALEIIELWLQGKVTKDEVAKAASDASDVSYAAVSNAYTTTYYIYTAISYVASDASYAASNASEATQYSAFTTSNASKALDKPLEEYYTKLLKFIDNISKLEKVIYDFTR